MYSKEIKESLMSVNSEMQNLNQSLINIKTAIHTLDKLGFKMDRYYKALDKYDIDSYEFKKIMLMLLKEVK